MKHPMKGQSVLIVEDVADYRAAIGEVVSEGDCVLEVGCHEGVTTRRVAQVVGEAGRVVGVDTSDICIERAKVAYDELANLRFHVGDARDISFLRKLSPDRDYDVVFLDISGSRDLETLIPLIESYEFALKPRLVVCKSFRLKRLYLNCTLFNYHPAAHGQKMDGTVHGEMEYVRPTGEGRQTLKRIAQVKCAKGVLPRDAETGDVDLTALPVNAKRNGNVGSWGSGRDKRKQRAQERQTLKKENPAERARLVEQNTVHHDEARGRGQVNKDYDNELLALCRSSRTAIRQFFKGEAADVPYVLHWSKPVGHITWTLKSDDEKEAA